MMRTINKKLSPAQRKMIESLRKVGKLRCAVINTKTYNALIDMGLSEYDDSYDYIQLTNDGKIIDLNPH